MQNFNFPVATSTESSVLDTSTYEIAVAMGSVTAVTPAAQANAKDLTKQTLEKAAKAAEKAAIKAAAEAKETAIALAVKDALSKGVELHPNLTRDLHRILTHPI